MKTNGISSGSKTGQSGFNLMELVVVLMTIGLLAIICLPAAATTRGQTKVAQCANNLKQVALALQMFAAENNDKLPANTGAITPYWAWDLAWSAGNSITQYMPSRNFYCPGTNVRFTSQDNSNLWNFSPGYLHVGGYVTTFTGTPIITTNQNTSITPQRIVSGSTILPIPSTSKRVLIADPTISGSIADNQAGYLAGAQYNFTSIYGGYTVPHISAHLNGFIPAGGNVAMIDGHVQWRKFSEMDQRATSGIGFWW